MRQQLLRACLAFLLIMTGCSGKKGEDATQKLIDYGTGKTQVETYQGVRRQLKSINEKKSQQFNE